MATEARRDVFQAIADPTRRQIIELVAKKAMTLNAIADNFNISRPAISQHIKILNECGIIEIETIGRERYCKVQAQNLVPAFLWLEQYQQQWTERIDSFEKYVNKLQSKNKSKKNEQRKKPHTNLTKGF
jgi:DNA-binding transcriptional ArsR family regulator